MKSKKFYFKENVKFVSILSILLIALLAACDFYAIYDMFVGNAYMDTNPMQGVFYAFMLALFLEGAPTIAGFNVNELTDPYNKEKSYVLNGFVLAFCLAILAGALYYVYTTRTTSIELYGGVDAYKAGNYPKYPLDTLLRVSPILTSLFAFAISLFAFRSNALTKEKKSLDTLKEHLSALKADGQIAKKEHLIKKQMFWSKVSNEELPSDEEFGEKYGKCFSDVLTNEENKIRSQINEKVDMNMVSRLEQLKIELSFFTNIPEEILNIDIKDLYTSYITERA